MTSAPLVVVGSDGPRPFMRGILVQSMVSRGVPFDVALATATEIRDRIAERGQVRPDELADLVVHLLGDSFDLDAPPAVQKEPPRVIAPGRRRGTPFSKGILAVSHSRRAGVARGDGAPAPAEGAAVENQYTGAALFSVDSGLSPRTA